jgi:hypothetical protein
LRGQEMEEKRVVRKDKKVMESREDWKGRRTRESWEHS